MIVIVSIMPGVDQDSCSLSDVHLLYLGTKPEEIIRPWGAIKTINMSVLICDIFGILCELKCTLESHHYRTQTVDWEAAPSLLSLTFLYSFL